MTSEVELVDLVDRVVESTYEAGLPLLVHPICDAFILVMAQGMTGRDREQMITEIVVTVAYRISLQKKQTETRWLA